MVNTIKLEQKAKRIDMLIRSLEIASESKLDFAGPKGLAIFCASLIGEWELSHIPAGTPENLHRSSKPSMSWKTLLRGDYRVFIHGWLRKPSSLQSSELQTRISNLQQQLVLLRAKYSLLKIQLDEWQGTSSSGEAYDSRLDDAYQTLDLLLHHFSDFVEIQDGRLIERSAAQVELVNETRFSAYLSWRALGVQARR